MPTQWIQWTLTPKDVLEICIFLGTVVFFLYDRVALVKKHDEIIKLHGATLDTLDTSINTLTTALAALTAEFRMYQTMNAQFNPVRGRVEYTNGQNR